ncbi:MAG: efflux RND transporter permease subunit [Candidatus Eremiobacteraeota bacterium]|nr:efflux RND transporter permease subunit [Candidatus Eremiobacteraeota bacterium]
MKPLTGIGRLARYFLTSKLTPTIVIAISVWGIFAILQTPRQENPEITMPAATIFTQYSGGSAREVEKLLTERGERVLQEVPGISHIYATTTQDYSMLTVLFHVGESPSKSFVALYDQVNAHLGDLPPGASRPVITPLSVDDVPIIVLNLHGKRYNRGELYQAAQRLISEVRAIPGVSTVQTFGGRPQVVNVRLDPVKLAAYGVSAGQIASALGASNATQAVGALHSEGESLSLRAGDALTSLDAVRNQIVNVSDGQPVRLGQVATVERGLAPRENATGFGYAAGTKGGERGLQASVSIAIAKKAGTNAVTVANLILSRVKTIALPPGMTLDVTRNDGNKANLAVNELIQRLLEAIFIVVALLFILGWREALVVATAIPLTLFVTLGIGMIDGQSINRITLFALILSLGLLVDQAIVIVENIHRHYHVVNPHRSKAEATVLAVEEIGNPTTLATITVVLSFLPMLFVTGMMGPYMRPIPLNVPIAMIASLLIAFTITPWATYALLRNQKPKASHGTPKWILPFRNALAKMLADRKLGQRFLGILALALLVAAMLPALKLVKFRMLPDANETSFLVAIDAPPSSSIARTASIAAAVGSKLATYPQIRSYQTFVGTNAVPDLAALFQGTVFRNAPNQAEIHVTLLPKDRRSVESAPFVAQIRPALAAVATARGATLRILQVPPGPPVRDTILAKIYGPDPEVRRAIAARIVSMMQRERGVVDIDSSFKDLPAALNLRVDPTEAALAGVSVTDAIQTLAMEIHGAPVSTLHVPDQARPVSIFLRLERAYRGDPAALESLMLPSRNGIQVPLSAVVTSRAGNVERPLYRDDFRNVSYVGADMAGRSSTYAVIDMELALMRHPLPAGYSISWGGEWSLTNRVFADLGRAMLLAFILIYFLLVARFRSFMIPLVVLAAVPLAVIGVLPGFALLAPFGIYFSATAMIGLIALIGIVVRNSIILLDFIESKIKEGIPLHEALVEATTARTRPIFLTAAAGVLSSIVIAADPVWSGLAWALVFGMTMSAVLSVLAIPLLYGLIAEGRTRASDSLPTPGIEAERVRSIVNFPELDCIELESTALPRLLEGESVDLDMEIFRGEGDARDAVAYLSGPYRVEKARLELQSAYGSITSLQHLTLRSIENAPSWKELDRE